MFIGEKLCLSAKNSVYRDKLCFSSDKHSFSRKTMFIGRKTMFIGRKTMFIGRKTLFIGEKLCLSPINSVYRIIGHLACHTRRASREEVLLAHRDRKSVV